MNNRRLTILPLKIVIAIGSFLASISVVVASPDYADESYSPHSDWIIDKNAKLCGGYYKPPEFRVPTQPSKYPLPISIQADNVNYFSHGKSQLSGNVIVEQNDKKLYAPQVILTSSSSQKLSTIEAKGPIYYSDSSISLWGQSIIWNQELSQIEVSHGLFHYYPHHSRGEAKTITRHANNVVYLDEASYTTCPPDNKTWSLNAGKIKLNPNKGRGQAYHLNLKFKEIPILYLPYLDFPIDNRRKSGWLYPNLGSSSQNGQTLQIPFYWNIAPNYDATLYPTYLTERGFLLDTQFRYLGPNTHSLWEISWIPHDRKYKDFLNTHRSNSLNFSPGDPRLNLKNDHFYRFFTSLLHHTKLNRRLKWHVDFQYVSDDNYFFDLGNELDTANKNDLLQETAIQYYGIHWEHLLKIQAYQSLHPYLGPINLNNYQRLPQWLFSANYPNVWKSLQISTIGEWVHYYHSTNPFTGENVTHGQRFHLRPNISWQYRTLSHFFVPRIQWDYLGYDLKLSPVDMKLNKPQIFSRTLPIYDIDTGAYFEKPFLYKNKTYLNTIEPRIYYLYVPYRNQHLYPNFDSHLNVFNFNQLFRDNRFSGRDRISNANQVSLSVTTRLLEHESGEERLNASIGEIFYFTPRKVDLCSQPVHCQFKKDGIDDKHQSALIGQFKINFSHLSAWTYIEWDTRQDQLNQSTTSLQYKHPTMGQINAGYYWIRHNFLATDYASYTEENIEQTDISFTWPISSHLNALGRWQYDLIQRRTINLLGGIAYQGCCLSWQIAATRYIRPQDKAQPQQYRNGLFFTVVFRGLSSVGTQSNHFEKNIPGYQPLDHHPLWKS